MPFTIRKFDQELTLGEKMKALRKAANITISEMEQLTKISRGILQAFESGQYHKLPEPMYARNFLKIIAKTLKVDETYFLDLYEHECGSCDYMGKACLPRQRARASRFLVASRFVTIGLISLVAIAVVGYLGVQVRTIVRAPELIVTQPADGLTTEEATIVVTGQAEAGAHVFINGTPVLLSQDGLFEQEIALERGMNVITVEGAKRYSKKATQYRRVILDHQESVVLR